MIQSFDPITRDIIQNSLQAAADEMFAAIRRTAMSAIIYEVLDMGTGLTDSTGELVSSGAGIPTFVGMLDKAVKRIIARHPPNNIEPGDVFMVNDPYQGGVTHLNDIILAKPIFNDGRPIAWSAVTAHFNDIGGMAPGSMSTQATEIFQEGLRLPPIKLFAKNKLINSVMDILTANSRMPDFLSGDLWAGIAALRLGQKRVMDLVGRYGREAFCNAMADYLDFGHKVTLNGLRKLPHGEYFITEEFDDGRPYKIRLKIEPDHFLVDLTGCPDQAPGPHNLSREGAVIAAQMVMKSVTAPTRVCNGGTFRALTVTTRPGSVYDPLPPAAMGFNYEVRIRLLDLIWRTLAQALPDRMPSGHFASICGTMLGGIHPDTGRHYSIIEPELGGWGGSAAGDGNAAMFSACHGETYNCPAEINEMRNGLIVDRCALHGEAGGEGYHRGGSGLMIDYRIRSPQAWLTAHYTRSEHPPWPLAGGRPGSPNYIAVIRKNGQRERYASVTGLKPEPDDVVRIVTGTGAGWGDPRKRDRTKVARDLKNGYLTAERARRIYGFGGE